MLTLIGLLGIVVSLVMLISAIAVGASKSGKRVLTNIVLSLLFALFLNWGLHLTMSQGSIFGVICFLAAAAAAVAAFRS